MKDTIMVSEEQYEQLLKHLGEVPIHIKVLEKIELQEGVVWNQEKQRFEPSKQINKNLYNK